MTHHPHRKLMPDVRLWTGIAAVAVAILTVTEFSVQVFVVGARPSLDDELALVDFMTRTSNGTLLTILIDTMLMAALIVFLAGFRQLITHSEVALQWVADLAYGAGLVFVAVTLGSEEPTQHRSSLPRELSRPARGTRPIKPVGYREAGDSTTSRFALRPRCDRRTRRGTRARRRIQRLCA